LKTKGAMTFCTKCGQPFSATSDWLIPAQIASTRPSVCTKNVGVFTEGLDFANNSVLPITVGVSRVGGITVGITDLDAVQGLSVDVARRDLKPGQRSDALLTCKLNLG